MVKNKVKEIENVCQKCQEQSKTFGDKLWKGFKYCCMTVRFFWIVLFMLGLVIGLILGLFK